MEQALQVVADLERPDPQTAGRIVTMFTDASLCGQTGASGCGAWIKAGPEAGFQCFGPMRKCANSTEAELCAIAMGLKNCIARGLLRPGDRLMIQSDSTNALQAVRYATAASDSPAKDGLRIGIPKRPQSTKEGTPLGYIAQATKAAGIHLTVRHVRGHQADDGSRQTVNIICDRLARQGMRMARERIGDAE